MNKFRNKMQRIGVSDERMRELQAHPEIVRKSKDFFDGLCGACKGKVLHLVARENKPFDAAVLCDSCKKKYDEVQK